ncbi:DUF4390 domain-containing protein [Nitrogeniibacter mangrovi]|uniref:DUF4390 domain-containing protein n=1 Tax=Nitrogeniibacter mangrovi TaxID=2016596 RepID=A0A6C1BAC5_9RHOO|nr:DUF4390 domain-containing protein [Nitrogeniibacter mangrovi]QID19648.1 DUF4390 domain-containing protein [Nitrogeniibacter mangrovi]
MRLLLVLGPLFAMVAHADEPYVRYAEIVPNHGDYVINADISLDLNPRVREAIEQGVPVNFVAEASIESPRWYWFDETLATARLEFRLSYHPMTRSYRLGIGRLHQNFNRLDDAVRTMLSIRRWTITPMTTLTPGESYNVGVRFRLDTAQLPRPFQVSTLGSHDWQIDTDWMRWTFLASPVNRR